jgi:hypothetical protein
MKGFQSTAGTFHVAIVRFDLPADEDQLTLLKNRERCTPSTPINLFPKLSESVRRCSVRS